MSTVGVDWQNEFGITADGSTVFFAHRDQLTSRIRVAEISQAHLLRRAFDLLQLDGILCTENIPLVYFKQVKRIDHTQISELHRKFWNHGGAPILAIIGPLEVQIYSGFTRPVRDGRIENPAGFVETLARASHALRQFLPTVTSGEFFRRHELAFDPAQRVDRDLLDNLQATRERLIEATTSAKLDAKVLDALLCRLVFACYLFDRKIVGQAYLREIGLPDAGHLRDVLSLQPKSRAKKCLYDLFQRLGKDFNGDLFSDDLGAEAKLVSAQHIGPLDQFFSATDVETGQKSFWPYDFAAIPIEAISAIYERFLKSDKTEGAFYTPRFLAELVLDIGLAGKSSLLDQKYLDPACGSGIFLVGVFIRMAEQWKQENPEARNDKKARTLRKILCNSLCGIDVNPTACRITAFSLYLAYLDQLAPRDIQELQLKGHRLPTLVNYPDVDRGIVEGNIWCGDFFDTKAGYPRDADMVIGNPPWGSTAVKGTRAASWSIENQHPLPDRQIAIAFVLKVAKHVKANGRICLVLPHGTLFNLSPTALEFQRSFFKNYAVDCILNLADYQRFLFETAGHPALVLSYRNDAPDGPNHQIQYWSPKADWLVTRAEIITIAPEDRASITVGEVLNDLAGIDAPQIWKQRYWATPRDWRLVNRLSLYPRLRDQVRRAKEKTTSLKPWFLAVGFQPVTANDDPDKAEIVRLPSNRFIEATSPNLDLFLLPKDCKKLSSAQVAMRSGSNKNTDVFRAPHVLVPKGFTSTAYADFDVSFQDAIRAISGPTEDRELLIFLAAYLRSPLAKYFLFQTSSNWGISRAQVHVEELTRLPFPLPEATASPKRAQSIVKEVATIVMQAANKAIDDFIDRREIITVAEKKIEPLINEYFDVLPSEAKLIKDTVNLIIPSVRPTRQRRVVPTIQPTTPQQRQLYINQLCETLNGWSKSSSSIVRGDSEASGKLGIAIAILQKTSRSHPFESAQKLMPDLLGALEHLRVSASTRLNTFELIRGVKVFDGNRLYIVKPIGQRFWTETAALNDADEVAGTILMHQQQSVSWQ